MSPGAQPIIVKKKKAGHGGHHGGAWKVAYADFVTAMMAFFLVMWLVSQSKPVKAAVAGYFRDPGIFDQAKIGRPDCRRRPEARSRGGAASAMRSPTGTAWPMVSAPRSRTRPSGSRRGSPSRRT